MGRALRVAAVLGCVLVLLGVAGVVAGSFMEAQYDCVSGTGLQIGPVDESQRTDIAGNTTVFEDLSPTEQRIFLEAYTDLVENGSTPPTDAFGYSDTYRGWSSDWFDAASATNLYVEYRDETYGTVQIAADCGLSVGPFVRIGGILSSLLGTVLLGVCGVVRLRRRQGA